MDKIKKLFQVKRILAIALAVALAVTSAPVTAQAAPENPEQTETNVETNPTEENKEEAAAGTTEPVEPVTEVVEPVTEPTEPVEPVTEPTEPVEPVTEPAEPVEPTTVADEPVAVVDADAQEAQPTAETAAAGYSFAFDEEYEKTEYTYSQDGTDISSDGKTIKFEFLWNLELKKDGEHVAWLADQSDAVVATVTYQWFQGNTALGAAALLGAEGTNPTDVGVYTLKLNLPAKPGEGGYAAATGEFSFEITQAKVTVSLNTLTVAPGTKAQEVPVPSVNHVVGEDGKSFTYAVDEPSTADVNEAANNEVKFTPVIKDAETGEEVKGETVLTKDKDYVISVTPEFIGANKDKYAKNYKFNVNPAEQKLGIGALTATRFSVAVDNTGYPATAKVTDAEVPANDGEVAKKIQVVEAQAIADVVKDGKLAVKGPKLEAYDGEDTTTTPATEKWKDITATVTDQTLFEGTWYTAADYTAPWTEAGKAFCNLTVGGKMDAAPTAAGAYVYRYGYKGDQKQYAESYVDILVIVEVPEIIVKPTVAEGTKFFVGQTVADVLSKIDYELPYADDATKKFEKTDNMWGTSYADTGKTQPYQPRFWLYKKTKDGAENAVGLIDQATGLPVKLEKDAEYYVRFSGKKVVFWGNGTYSPNVDIMAAVDSMDPNTCGFTVKTDDDTNKANELKLDVSGTLSVINTSEITGGTSETVNVLGAFTKVYDGKRIFENYGDFRKAKLDSGEAEVKDFSYTWQKSNYSYEALKETEKKEDGKDGFVLSEEDIEDSFRNVSPSISPVNAGVYRLKITYSDSKNEKFAEPAYVYFVIKKQEITFNVSADLRITGYTGYAGLNSIRAEQMEALNKGTSMTVALEGTPTKSEDWKNAALLSGSAKYAYQVNWVIKKKLKENGQDKKDDKGNILFDDGFGLYDELTKDADTYVLMVNNKSLGTCSKNGAFTDFNTDYNQNFEVKNADKIMIPITVQDMGSDYIRFAGITTVEEGAGVLTDEKTYDAQSIYALIKDKLPAMNAPITVAEDGKTKKADVDAALTYTVEYKYSEYNSAVTQETYTKLPTEEADWAWTKDAGIYTIKVGFGGNEKYQPLNNVQLAKITVEPKELTLALPTLEKTYETGESVYNATADARKAFKELPDAGLKAGELAKVPEADKKFFTKTTLPNGEKGYLAWYDEDANQYDIPYLGVYDNTDKVFIYDTFQSVDAGRYSLKYDSYNFNSEVRNNYAIAETSDPASTPIKVGRGAASVWLDELASGKKLDINDKISEGTAPVAKEHVVKVLDAIPYKYNSNDSKQDGNLVNVCINAPEEYQRDRDFSWENVSYEQSIKNNAKENLVGEITERDYTDEGENWHFICFVYDATDKTDLSFTIRWAADYSEHFTIKFSEAETLGNLRDAVAPKSLAFNAPITAMVVGQEQNLDVKITKEQTGDVICLGYEVTEGEGTVLHVSEHGKVTALGEGKGTVAVYPMHLVDGKKVKIETNAKGKAIKPATVKITVKKVAAPKVSKVIANDTYVNVQYALPKKNDGYRREIYVMEGKNLTMQNFEDEISAMKNQQWKGHFAAAPQFMSWSEEKDSRVYDGKKHASIDTVSVWFYGLKPAKKDYTVYVRNVSAMRSCEDGCKVTLSVAGTTKGFTTTLTEADGLVATLKDLRVYGTGIYDEYDSEWYDTYYKEDEQPTEDDIRSADRIIYAVPLSEKSVQISLEALFRNEVGDDFYLPLPLSKDDKKNYNDPKITYYFCDYIYDGYDPFGHHVTEDADWTTSSKIATVAKNGKVTLKETGWVGIQAYDSVSGRSSGRVDIYVVAKADSITARKASMQVGQQIRLADLVDYKEGNAKLGQSYNDSYGRRGIDVKAAQASLGTSENFVITDDGYLVATGVGSAQFDLTDVNIEGTKGTAKIKVTSKALDGVKNLNVINVIDNRFDVRFEMNPYAEAYRIKVTDGRGTTIRSIYVENLPFNYDGTVYWDGNQDWNSNDYPVDYYGSWRPWDINDNDDWGTGDSDNWDNGNTHNREHWVNYNGTCRADMIKGKMNLTYPIRNLVQTSKYNVEVTALYQELAPSKPAKKSVTTTKLPARDYCVSDDYYVKGSAFYKNGYYYSDGMRINVGDQSISGYPFVSGNTYSLQVPETYTEYYNGSSYTVQNYNRGARYAGTDTLTWTSSNTKVATVQATSGGYSARLNAVKDGYTVIEVRSAVLKGVIARWTIGVNTVGDAYNGRNYYGDNENLRGNGYGNGATPKYSTNTINMVVGVPKTVDIVGGATIKFTAEEEGTYVLYKGTQQYTQWSIGSYETPCTKSVWVSGSYTGSLIIKRTGSTDYSSVTDFKNRKNIKAGEAFSATDGQWFAVTVPEAGLYGIRHYSSSSYSTYYANVYTAVKEGDTLKPGVEPSDTISPVMGSMYELEKDQLIYLQANVNNRVVLEKVNFAQLNVNDNVTLSSHSYGNWYQFRAAEAGDYEFTFDATSDCYMNAYKKSEGNYSYMSVASSTSEGKTICTITFTAGDEVYVNLQNSNSTPIKVSVSKQAVATPTP